MVAGAIYHTVFRLADSLPASVVERYRQEREALVAEAGSNPPPAVQARLDELFSAGIERYLDAGSGACFLARSPVANLVADSLRYFDGARYALHAWCVMPNHVHVVFEPTSGQQLETILHSWKSFTSTAANRLLGRHGTFWQKESYDHIVRTEAELARTIVYVRENPNRAGLGNWAWVWPS
jgi:REP element-mobilizing transposase RayT